MSTIKLVIADRREIFSHGLAEVLGSYSNIDVICCCITLQESIEAASKNHPDVVLIDIDWPDGDSFEAIRSIHQELPEKAIVVLTHSTASSDFYSAFDAGATAFISKDICIESLIKAIYLAAEGEIIISPPIATRLLAGSNLLKRHYYAAELGPSPITSPQEGRVLSLVAQGLSNREVANKLFISENTMKVHLRNIMAKLHAHNRQEAVNLARASNLLS